jgi:hypothetical protein
MKNLVLDLIRKEALRAEQGSSDLKSKQQQEKLGAKLRSAICLEKWPVGEVDTSDFFGSGS